MAYAAAYMLGVHRISVSAVGIARALNPDVDGGLLLGEVALRRVAVEG
jgi:hypothetical protein